ncbi:unnamed protein product [Hymenolepis diminuta]|uniref:Uncharacterized protein n=1 Tax=Hymenolepis diminuta TaxID=6216 RepID=A0A0R3SNH0_HYMDI|nr:unnamed protein product [Hymenolepis diminuta]
MLNIRTLTCIGILLLLIVVIASSPVESESQRHHNRDHLPHLKEVGKEEDLHLGVRKASFEISPKSSKTSKRVAPKKKKRNRYSIFSFFNLPS